MLFDIFKEYRKYYILLQTSNCVVKLLLGVTERESSCSCKGLSEAQYGALRENG